MAMSSDNNNNGPPPPSQSPNYDLQHLTYSSQVPPAAAADPLVPRRCANCDTTSTDQWRIGPNKSLCYACGIRFNKERSEASGDAAAAANNQYHFTSTSAAAAASGMGVNNMGRSIQKPPLPPRPPAPRPPRIIHIPDNNNPNNNPGTAPPLPTLPSSLQSSPIQPPPIIDLEEDDSNNDTTNNANPPSAAVCAKQVPPPPPRIIHEIRATVIKVKAEDFKSVVQKLTGLPSSGMATVPSPSSSSSPDHDDTSNNSPPQLPDPNNNSSYGGSTTDPPPMAPSVAAATQALQLITDPSDNHHLYPYNNVDSYNNIPSAPGHFNELLLPPFDTTAGPFYGDHNLAYSSAGSSMPPAATQGLGYVMDPIGTQYPQSINNYFPSNTPPLHSWEAPMDCSLYASHDPITSENTAEPTLPNFLGLQPPFMEQQQQQFSVQVFGGSTPDQVAPQHPVAAAGGQVVQDQLTQYPIAAAGQIVQDQVSQYSEVAAEAGQVVQKDQVPSSPVSAGQVVQKDQVPSSFSNTNLLPSPTSILPTSPTTSQFMLPDGSPSTSTTMPISPTTSVPPTSRTVEFPNYGPSLFTADNESQIFEDLSPLFDDPIVQMNQFGFQQSLLTDPDHNQVNQPADHPVSSSSAPPADDHQLMIPPSSTAAAAAAAGSSSFSPSPPSDQIVPPPTPPQWRDVLFCHLSTLSFR